MAIRTMVLGATLVLAMAGCSSENSANGESENGGAENGAVRSAGGSSSKSSSTKQTDSTRAGASNSSVNYSSANVGGATHTSSSSDAGSSTPQGTGGSSASESGGSSNGGTASQGNTTSLPQSCLAILSADPKTQSGVYDIDVDGAGNDLPIKVYCDMATAGGGWQLVSVVAEGQTKSPIVGEEYCTSRSETDACHGQIHPQQVAASNEILVYSGADRWVIYGGFSGSQQSALRYVSRKRKLTMDDSCKGTEHVCADRSLDPDLHIRQTSGFPAKLQSPLQQTWQRGGWSVGVMPEGELAGSTHALLSGSGVDGLTELRYLPEGAINTRLISSDSQLIFHRDVSTSTCSNGKKDGLESDVDCGGLCDDCATGKKCSTDEN